MEDPFHDDEGGVIANMEVVRREVSQTVKEAVREEVDKDNMDKDSDSAEPVILSPERINRTTTGVTSLPNPSSEGRQEIIHNMLRERVETRGGEVFPPALQLLADHVGVASSGGGTDTHTSS